MAFLRVVAALAQYGSRAVSWAWSNRRTIELWLARGMGVAAVVDQIRRILGL